MKDNTPITISAPGKLLLMGDHAVVYGHPCLVTAIDKRVYATVTILDERLFQLESPDIGVHGYSKPLNNLGHDMQKEVRFAETAVRNFYDIHPQKHGVRIVIKSDFSSRYGFGSSSATVVAVLVSLAFCFKVNIPQRDMFALAHKTVLDVQGTGSGFDVAAAIYGGTLCFVTAGRVIEPLRHKAIPMVVGYTGVKADTATLVDLVAQKRKKETVKVDRIFEAVTQLVDEAKDRVTEGDFERVGKLMDFNQEYLRDLGISSEKLESLISAAKKAGAFGAKLSGAGGGDCMIALHPDGVQGKLSIEKAIQKAGGEAVDISTGAEGVRIDLPAGGAGTTDDQDELFIIVDKNDTIFGYKTRYECHHDPLLIHRTVGVLLYNAKGELLLQKRSITKDMEPGLWGISAAGHVTKGQTDDEAVHRELKEELGIDVPLTFVKKFIVSGGGETERVVIYKGFHGGPFIPDANEVDCVEFFAVETLKTKISGGEIILTTGATQTLREAGIHI